VNCDTQEEIDRLWDRLSEGAHYSLCGVGRGPHSASPGRSCRVRWTAAGPTATRTRRTASCEAMLQIETSSRSRASGRRLQPALIPLANAMDTAPLAFLRREPSTAKKKKKDRPARSAIRRPRPRVERTDDSTGDPAPSRGAPRSRNVTSAIRFQREIKGWSSPAACGGSQHRWRLDGATTGSVIEPLTDERRVGRSEAPQSALWPRGSSLRATLDAAAPGHGWVACRRLRRFTAAVSRG
jgi:hypothetical protein